ncbi:SH3 domain-containing protein [Peptococcus simiae]|uniref:SH3 domain-containing protein n=1 Tax=Peptococcus simiae TaxID=1643805 RepID=A0ABW9GXT3_9FIRM
MKLKNVLIALAIAVVVGLALGSIIAYTSGALFGPKDPLVTTSSSDVETSLVNASELEDQQKKEDRAKAEKALSDAEKESKKADQTSSEKKTKTQSTESATTQAQSQQAANTQAAAPQQQQQTQTGGGSATINVQGADLNMRAAADPSATIVGSVSNGTQVTVLDRANGMVHIQTGDGRQAWVAQDYVNG